MLGDVELQGNYNIPVKKNSIVLPEETGVELGEEILLVEGLNKTNPILIDADVYMNVIREVLINEGYDPDKLILPLRARKILRTMAGRAVKNSMNVKEGNRIVLGRQYEGIKRVTLISHKRSFEIVPVKTY